MQTLSLDGRRTARLNVLCLGAHSDDIEIGCGGLVLSLVRRLKRVRFDWVVFSAAGARATEARRGARAFLADAPDSRVRLHKFRDGFFPYEGAALKEVFERLKRECSPDLVLTHYRDDRHQDHRVLSDLTWNTFRNHWILEYEIPKFDGDFGSPNVFVPLEAADCRLKVQHLERTFGSQRDKHWFGTETFMAVMRLRGMECRAPGGYAEAFYSRKAVLSL
jgi:LmbE family N-acetylglucosaminyl deacetylase